MKKTKTPEIPAGCMLLPRDLLACASTDPARASLHGAHVDAGNRTIAVCNGPVLATLPIPGDEPVKPCFITPAKMKAAKAMLKKSEPLVFDFVNATLAGLPLDDVDCHGFSYPNYQAVIPKEEIVYRQVIDPGLLLDVASSMGRTGEGQGITLEFAKGEHDSVRLKIGEALGVIMPMRGPDQCGLLAKQPAGAPATAPERSGTDAAEVSRLKTELHLADESRKALAADVEALRAKLEAAGAGDATPTPPKREGKKAKDAPAKEVALATGPPALARNEERNGIELRFDGKPDDTTREAMKGHGFRWCPGQPGQPWVAKYSEENWVFAMSLAEGRGVPVPQPGEVPDAGGPCNPPTGKDEAPAIHTAVIHGGESITPADLAKRLFSGRDGKIPTPAELAAERAAAEPPKPRRILPDF